MSKPHLGGFFSYYPDLLFGPQPRRSLAVVHKIERILRRLKLMFWSDGPVRGSLFKKSEEYRRKHRRQDYSQDPNGLGMYRLSAGNVHEAGKPDHTRNGTHGKSN